MYSFRMTSSMTCSGKTPSPAAARAITLFFLLLLLAVPLPFFLPAPGRFPPFATVDFQNQRLIV